MDKIGAEYFPYISVRFEAINDSEVCIIDVESAPIPAYLDWEGRKEFFTRAGNTTRSLDTEDTVKYITLNFD